MRFTCSRPKLAEVAALVGQAVAGKSTKKIFECLRLVADANSLEVAGTDLEVSVRLRLVADADGKDPAALRVTEPGTAVVPAPLFAGLLREIGDETVTVSVAAQKLTLDTDGGRFEVECEDPSQFPDIPEFPAEATGRVDPADLRTLVRKTIFATGKEAARFVLNGVRISAEDAALRFVGCDGRRLAILARPMERTGGETRASIVGVKGLQHFERAAAAADGPVELAITDRFVAVRAVRGNEGEGAGGTVVTARVLDGTFPDFEQILPDPDQVVGVASIPVALLASRLRQVGQFTGVQSQAVVLELKPGELSVSAAGSDGRGDARVAIDYDGPEEKVGFNPAYLLDALKVIDDGSIRFSVTGRNSAAKVEDDGGFVYVVMPVLID
ncbi:MAG: DNA polymerase III subunit beta [Planctomycetota bacterium]|jgi:DNA polymerase-3 subunit beta